MPAGSYNITIEQGTTYGQTLTWRDSNSALVNLTGYTARMQIRTDYTASAPTLSLTTENGRITLGGALGTIALSIAATDTASLAARKYVYDLELISSSLNVTRLIQGTVTVVPEVTR